MFFIERKNYDIPFNSSWNRIFDLWVCRKTKVNFGEV
jgi:hypothetical protein